MPTPRRSGSTDTSSPSDADQPAEGPSGADRASDPLSGTIDVARDGVLVTDADGAVRYVNPTLLTQVRLQASQLLGRDVRALLAPPVDTYDPVTGLAREDRLAERARPLLALARRKGRAVAVARLVVEAGRALPEETMRVVAARLEASVRDTDLVARPADGTFALVLQEVNPDESLGRAVERILGRVRESVVMDGKDVEVTARVGMALFPRDASGWDELMDLASSALVRATDTDSAFSFYEEGLTIGARDRLRLEHEFAAAADDSQLLLHYQPVVAMESGRMVGAEALTRGHVMGIEALARWPHHTRGQVPPAEFIPIAEQTGRILWLDRWAVATAIGQASAWWAQGWTGWVSVNLSTRSIRDPEIAGYIGELLRRRDAPPDRLVLEITESAAMRDPEATIANLHALKALGVRLAIDDFGTGHSSLNYLKRLPVDYIKLDRSFLENVATDEKDRWLIETIVALAHRIGAQVVAEGVEKSEELDWLRSTGCDLVQGFLTGRPAPADQMDPGRLGAD